MDICCKGCGKEKPATLEYFRKESKNKSGLTGKCRECKTKMDQQWREDNKEHLAEYNKQHRSDINRRNYEKHIDKRRADARERMSTPEAKARTAARLRRLRATDPAYKIATNVSRAVRQMLNGNSKKSRTFDALPYTPQQLREHLESQFADWMTWENYGSRWDIDHIYPQSLLPYDSLDHPNFIRCWSLDNLQPLDKIANIQKSNRILRERK